jgi:eukaryotic-like serine/threonine-protein kinase
MPVGAGGMGRVWAARRLGAPSQSLVALKTALEEMIGDREFESILLDEARIASSIVHPNVCAIRELGAERGVPYLVMEWVDAGTLLDVLSACPDHRIDTFVAIRIIAEVAAGLHAAHELTGPDGNLLNVVHRDVSPQNILLSSKGHVKVADFGVARARGQLHKPTETGELKGKLSYMSPEQLTSKIFDRRADVFALGCCLYEATTGQRPFHGGDALETMYKLLETECINPTAIVADYPPELEAVVLRSLEKEADKRFQTAEELRTALEAILARNGRLVTDRDVSQLVKATLQPVLDARSKALADANQAILEKKSDTDKIDLVQTSTEEVSQSSTGKTQRVWNTDPPDLVRKNRRMLMLGAAVAAAALIAALVWPKGEKVASQAPIASASSAAMPNPSAQLISITLRTDPPGADIRIDDGPATRSPLTFETGSSTRSHGVTASLAGYESQHREVVFDHNQDIILGLKPQIAPPALSASTSAKPNPASKRSATPPADPNGNKPRRSKRSLDSSNPFADP